LLSLSEWREGSKKRKGDGKEEKKGGLKKGKRLTIANVSSVLNHILDKRLAQGNEDSPSTHQEASIQAAATTAGNGSSITLKSILKPKNKI
jgi:hypothetical protein